MLLCFYCHTDGCLVYVNALLLFLTVAWVGLQCFIVVLWYFLIIFTFCVTCEAWSIHRDHDSLCVVVVVGGVGVTLLVSDQLHLKGCIYFIQSLKKIKHH